MNTPFASLPHKILIWFMSGFRGGHSNTISLPFSHFQVTFAVWMDACKNLFLVVVLYALCAYVAWACVRPISFWTERSPGRRRHLMKIWVVSTILKMSYFQAALKFPFKMLLDYVQLPFIRKWTRNPRLIVPGEVFRGPRNSSDPMFFTEVWYRKFILILKVFVILK